MSQRANRTDRTGSGPRHRRRAFLKAGCGAACAAILAPILSKRALAAPPPALQYQGLDSDKYLSAVTIAAKVVDQDVFTEGPAVNAEGVVFFTNVPASKILTYSPQTKRLSVFREKTNNANGLTFDPRGRLLACEGGAGRVTRTDMSTEKIEVLAERYHGLPLAPPNDLCMDDRDRIYFTSRPSTFNPSQTNVNAVYRLDPDGTLTQILRSPGVHMPNGIDTSPDNKTLYVIESHPDTDHHRDIRAYDLSSDGTVANERVLINFYPGRSGDGMAVDTQGNLYVAAGLHKTRNTSETLDTKPGIHVISPSGKLLAYRQTPEDTITNCTFGGDDLRTLYVTCGSLLLSIRTNIPGKPSYRPRG
jgi:gluconolactonase